MPETQAELEPCANCLRPIGRLETSELWQESVVCPECYSKLYYSAPVVAAEPAPVDPLQQLAYASASPPRRKAPIGRDAIICPNPNCGYRGTAARVKRSRPGVSISLILCWLGFGLLYGMTHTPDMWIVSVGCFFAWLVYTIAMHGTVLRCPQCRATVRP